MYISVSQIKHKQGQGVLFLEYHQLARMFGVVNLFSFQHWERGRDLVVGN